MPTAISSWSAPDCATISERGGALMGAMQMLVQFNDNSQFDIVTPTVMWLTLGSVGAASLLLTLFCTFVSVNRHLRMSDDKLFTK